MGLESFDGIFIISCCEDYRWWLFYQFQHFKAINFWHLHIQENKVGLMLRYCFYPFKTIATSS